MLDATRLFVCMCMFALSDSVKSETCDRNPVADNIVLPLPKQGNKNIVLDLDDIKNYVDGKIFRSVYHMHYPGNRLHYGLDMLIELQSGSNDKFDRKLTYDAIVNPNPSDCQEPIGISEPYKNGSSVFRITVDGFIDNDEFDMVEISFSSCPSLYVCSLVCWAYYDGAQTCPKNNTLLMVKVPSREQKEDELDNLDWEQIAKDIRTNTNMELGKMTGMNTRWTYREDNSCKGTNNGNQGGNNNGK